MAIVDKIYARLPIPFQHVAASTQGLKFRLVRSNDRLVRERLEFLKRSEYWSAEQHAEYQSAQLRETIRHAFENVPHYRELRVRLGIGVEDVKDLDDIRKLPILEKTDVRGNEKRFVDDRRKYRRINILFTSGTTGTPLKIHSTPEDFASRWGHVARLRTWAGLPDPIHPRRAQFTGRNIVPTRQAPDKHVYWRHNWADNALLMSTTHISPLTAPYYAEALRRFAPDLIDGYPSAVSMIARIAMAQGLSLPRPKAIITSAETLLDEDRAVMEEAFGCQVYDQYAASEPSCFWSTCEAGSMHIHPEYGISEVVDENGMPVQPGEEGDVVVTSFLTPVFPLIRYRLGDRAVLASPDMRCACGREMPIVSRVVGRKDDILYVPERGYVGRLDPVFKGTMPIIEAQIIQEELERVVVKLVPAPGWNDAQQRALMDNLRAKLGTRVRIEIETVGEIPRGANGKFKAVVSKVKDEYPALV